MSKPILTTDTKPLSDLSKAVFSVAETARLLGYEQTTVYRLIWREELRICAGTARYRVPRAEIERFLARTETFGERVHSRSRTTGSKRKRKVHAQRSLTHPSQNPHMLFVPRAIFGDRPIGGRLLKTVVPDDESLPAQDFVEVDEDEWNGEM